MDLLSRAAGERAPSAIWALMAHVCPNRPAYQRWTDRIARETGGAVEYAGAGHAPVYFRWQEHRAQVYEAITELASSYGDRGITLLPVIAFLESRSGDEASVKARPAAKRTFEALLSMAGTGVTVPVGQSISAGPVAEDDDDEDALEEA